MSAPPGGQRSGTGGSALDRASGLLGALGFRRRVMVYGTVAAIVVLVVLPQLPFVDTYWTGILSRMLIFAIFAMSLDLLIGYTGLPSLGHAAFFGTGAYSAGIFYKDILCPSRGDCLAVVGNFWFALLLGYCGQCDHSSPLRLAGAEDPWGLLHHDHIGLGPDALGHQLGLALEDQRRRRAIGII